MRNKIILTVLGLAAVVSGGYAYAPLLFGEDTPGDLDTSSLAGPSDAVGADPIGVIGAEGALDPDPGPETADPKTAAADPPGKAGPPASPADAIIGPKVFAGPIDRSLYQTFAGRLPRKLADPLTAVTGRLLVWWLDPSRDLRKGDAIEVLYLPTSPEPRVLALRFSSGKAGKTFEAYAFQPEKDGPMRYFDAEGVEVEARLKNSPIDTYEQVTSLLSDGRGHQGVDFKCPIGTPVKAPFDVTVSRVNWSTRRNGNCLDLSGPGGVHVLFLHLDKMAEGIRPGRKVKQGEIVAYSGNTGRSTAPHLHYQLQKGRRVIDPFKHHSTSHLRLSEGTRAAFQKEKARLTKKLSAGEVAAR